MRFFYGWVMLAVVILGLFACYTGQSVGIAVFNPSFRESLDLNHSQVAGAYGVATLLAGGAAFITGAVSDRFGIRRTMTVVVILMGGACIFMLGVHGLISLFFAFLFLRILGHGALPLLVDNTLAMWFHRRLGLVYCVKNIAAAGAVAAIPTLNLWLIHNYGWQRAYAILGIAVWVVMLPLLLFVYRNRPEDVGQCLDGIADTDPHPASEPDSGFRAGSAESANFDLRGALRTRSFWIMIAGNMVAGMVWAGTVFNIVPLFESYGFTDQQAAATMALFAIFMAALQPLAGFLTDRLPLNLLLSVSAAAVTAAMAILLSMNSLWMAHLFAVVFGFGNGLRQVVDSTLWPRYFGRNHLGKIRGCALTAIVVGSSVGPLLLGKSYDHFKSFDISIYIFLGANALLAVVCLFVTRPR